MTGLQMQCTAVPGRKLSGVGGSPRHYCPAKWGVDRKCRKLNAPEQAKLIRLVIQ